jgi:hypothetical protein
MQAGLARALIPKAAASADFLTYTDIPRVPSSVTITDTEFVGNCTLLLDRVTTCPPIRWRHQARTDRDAR